MRHIRENAKAEKIRAIEREAKAELRMNARINCSFYQLKSQNRSKKIL